MIELEIIGTISSGGDIASLLNQLHSFAIEALGDEHEAVEKLSEALDELEELGYGGY